MDGEGNDLSPEQQRRLRSMQAMHQARLQAFFQQHATVGATEDQVRHRQRSMQALTEARGHTVPEPPVGTVVGSATAGGPPPATGGVTPSTTVPPTTASPYGSGHYFTPAEMTEQRRRRAELVQALNDPFEGATHQLPVGPPRRTPPHN